MAVISNQRGTVLQIVNDVRRRMNWNSVASLSADRTALKLTTFLNDVIQVVSDFGDWPQLYAEVNTTVAACAIQVEINASAPIKRIHEIHEGVQVTPLVVRTIEEIRLFNRGSAAGTPRHFALVDTSGINPRIRIHPRRTTTAMGFNAAVYVTPLLYASADASKIPPWSKTLLVQGLMAQAYADEAGGESSPQSQRAQGVFLNMLKEEWNRSNVDLGTDVYVYPERR